MTTYTCAQALIGDKLVNGPKVRVEGELFCGAASNDRSTEVDLGEVTLVPGFVDMHVHGGGGFGFGDGPASARKAAQFHLRHGTTGLLASLATASLEQLTQEAADLTPLVNDGTLAGLHFEGPFLEVSRRGAHNAELLRNPDLDWLRANLTGAVKMVTLAPELPGGIEAVRLIVERGALAALGHSDATYDEARAAIDAGVRVATHLFNGMRPVHHREPAAIIALMRDPRVTVELINDGVHVHGALVDSVFSSVTASRVALITDAIAATGMPDGVHELAGSAIRVTNGIAELVDGSSLAGSTVTMDAAIRNTVAAGVSLVDAIVAASTTPARALNLTDRGEIADGKRADLVVLDPHLRVVGVMSRGEWIVDPTGRQTTS